MYAGVCKPGRVGVCMGVRACSLAYPACNSYALYVTSLCGPSGLSMFFDIISQTEQFSENIEHKMCFDSHCKFCLKHFSF
jgi:hypothetical protein